MPGPRGAARQPPSPAVPTLLAPHLSEPRPATALDLGQLGDDEGARQGLVSILGIQSGFAGWTARVIGAGRVRSSCTIAKVNVAIPE